MAARADTAPRSARWRLWALVPLLLLIAVVAAWDEYLPSLVGGNGAYTTMLVVGNAAGALAASKLGAQASIPDHHAVEAFLRSQPRTRSES